MRRRGLAGPRLRASCAKIRHRQALQKEGPRVRSTAKRRRLGEDLYGSSIHCGCDLSPSPGLLPRALLCVNAQMLDCMRPAIGRARPPRRSKAGFCQAPVAVRMHPLQLRGSSPVWEVAEIWGSRIRLNFTRCQIIFKAQGSRYPVSQPLWGCGVFLSSWPVSPIGMNKARIGPLQGGGYVCRIQRWSAILPLIPRGSNYDTSAVNLPGRPKTSETSFWIGGSSSAYHFPKRNLEVLHSTTEAGHTREIQQPSTRLGPLTRCQGNKNTGVMNCLSGHLERGGKNWELTSLSLEGWTQNTSCFFNLS